MIPRVTGTAAGWAVLLSLLAADACSETYHPAWTGESFLFGDVLDRLYYLDSHDGLVYDDVLLESVSFIDNEYRPVTVPTLVFDQAESGLSGTSWTVTAPAGETQAVALRMAGEAGSENPPTFWMDTSSLTIQAYKAVEGGGNFELYASSLKSEGLWDFGDGTLKLAMSSATLINNSGGLTRIGTLHLTDTEENYETKRSSLQIGELTQSGHKTARVHVNNLILDGGDVAVVSVTGDGKREDGTFIYSNGPACLVVDRINGRSGVVRVSDRSILALGINLDGFKPAEGEESIDELTRIVNDASVQTPSSNRSTLVVGASGIPTLPDGVRILVGDTQDTTSSVVIGSSGRLLVLFDEAVQGNFETADDVSLLTETVDSGTQGIKVESGSIVLSGWDGSQQAIENLGWINAASGTTVEIFGLATSMTVTVGADGKLVVQKNQWLESTSLKANNIVTAVDGMTTEEGSLPGAGFIRASLTVPTAGSQVAPYVINAGVFLPFTSGSLVVAERSWESLENGLFDRSHLPMDGNIHWSWGAWGKEVQTQRLMENAGFDLEMTGFSFGADKAFGSEKNPWIVSLVFSGASGDAKYRGDLTALKGESTTAAASLMVSRSVWGGEGRLALTYAQSDLEGSYTAVGHGLKSEPEMRLYALSGKWSCEKEGGESWKYAPHAGFSVYHAKGRKAEITDYAHSTGQYGTGFVTRVQARTWGAVNAGVDLSGKFEVYGCEVEPYFGLNAKVRIGPRDWKIRTNLADTEISDRASYRGIPAVTGRMEVGLTIADSGYAPEKYNIWTLFGESGGDKAVPYAWRLGVSFAMERSSGHETGKTLSLFYRERF